MIVVPARGGEGTIWSENVNPLAAETRAVRAEAADALPATLLALTFTRSDDPKSAALMRYVAIVCFGTSVHFEPPARQRSHWYVKVGPVPRQRPTLALSVSTLRDCSRDRRRRDGTRCHRNADIANPVVLLVRDENRSRASQRDTLRIRDWPVRPNPPSPEKLVPPSRRSS